MSSVAKAREYAMNSLTTIALAVIALLVIGFYLVSFIQAIY